MPTFKFRLEKVLNYKKEIEENLKRELAQLQKKYYEEEKILFALFDEQKTYQEELKEKCNDYLDVFEIICYYYYLAKLERDIVKQKLILEELQKNIDKKIEEVISASKERKLLEKLKERKYEEFQKYISSLEQKFLDEIGVNAFVRNKI